MNATSLLDHLPITRAETITKHTSPVWPSVLGLSLTFLATEGVEVFQIFVAWSYGDWRYTPLTVAAISFLVGGIIIGVLLVIGLAYSITEIRRQVRGRPSTMHIRKEAQKRASTALLAALASPKDATLPRKSYTPIPVALMTQRRRIAPLAHFRSAPDSITLWIIVSFIAILLFTGASLLSTSLATLMTGNAQNDAAYLMVYTGIFQIETFFFFPLLVIGGLLLPLFITQRKGYRLFANNDGLWWQHLGKWVHVPWSAIRTIGVYSDEAIANASEAYIIVSEEELLLWQLPLAPSVAQAQATQELLSLVLTQTGLPLRDLTPLRLALVYETNATLAQQIPTLQGEEAVPPPDTAMLAQVAMLMRTPTARPKGRRVNTVIVASLIFTVICALGIQIGASYLHDRIWPDYLATLPALLQHQTPLINASLTTADAGWPLHTPDKQGGDAFGFTKEGYTITNGGGWGLAALPDIYHAVAIQVTLRISGRIVPNTTEGAGIIVRQQATTDGYPSACVFLITMEGYWHTTCFTAPETRGTFSPYVRQGANATNTILVIARGQFFSFYINGHAVGTDFEELTEPFGQIGLTNQLENTSATFTDFKVWRINAPPNPRYV